MKFKSGFVFSLALLTCHAQAQLLMDTSRNLVNISAWMREGVPHVRITQTGSLGGCPVIFKPMFDGEDGTEFIKAVVRQLVTLEFRIEMDLECLKIQRKLGNDEPRPIEQVISLEDVLKQLDRRTEEDWTQFFYEHTGLYWIRAQHRESVPDGASIWLADSTMKLMKNEEAYRAKLQEWIQLLRVEQNEIQTEKRWLLGPNATWIFQMQESYSNPNRLSFTKVEIPIRHVDRNEKVVYESKFKNGPSPAEVSPQPQPMRESPAAAARVAEEAKPIVCNLAVPAPAADLKKEEAEKPAPDEAQKSDEGNCVVCLDAKTNIVFLDCAHLATCEKCADQVKACPICRKPIGKKIKVYKQ